MTNVILHETHPGVPLRSKSNYEFVGGGELLERNHFFATFTSNLRVKFSSKSNSGK